MDPRGQERGVAWPRMVAAAIAAVTGAATELPCDASAVAQNKPFTPERRVRHTDSSPHLIVTASDVMSSYDNWKSRYLKTDCGNGYYRVEFGNPKGSTVSEGVGYGMLISVYFGDRAAFDGLWKFVQKNLNPNRLMGWKETCSGFITGEGGGGSATDGDTDIGMALVAAVDQWGDAYRQTALDYLATLKKVDYTTCTPSGRAISKDGDWAGCDHTNTSYWMPGFYRAFKEFTVDRQPHDASTPTPETLLGAFWAKAADDALDLWKVNRNPATGLIANEVDQNGATAQNNPTVDYNGCRTPWRAVVDYLWYGTPAAKDVTDKISDWANGVGISKVVDGYNINGTPSQYGKNTQVNAWVGRLALRALRPRAKTW